MTVTLRELVSGDAAALAAALDNKKVQDNLRDGLPFPYTEKDGAEYIGAVLAAQEGSQFVRGVCVDGTLIGNIGVFRKDNVHRLTAELGYYIGEAYWGRGVMSEAVRQMCAFVFENSDIVRIFADPYSHNKASCRVLEKAGFTHEGTLRQNAIKNGEIIDMELYAIMKPEK